VGEEVTLAATIIGLVDVVTVVITGPMLVVIVGVGISTLEGLELAPELAVIAEQIGAEGAQKGSDEAEGTK